MKEFTIKYQGQPATIQVEDKPKWGLTAKLGKMGVTWVAGKPLPDINATEYAIALACNLIIKAPWGTTTPDIINSMDAEEGDALASILCDVLPLERFLSLQGKAMYGKKLEISPTQTEYTTSSASGELPSVR